MIKEEFIGLKSFYNNHGIPLVDRIHQNQAQKQFPWITMEYAPKVRFCTEDLLAFYCPNAVKEKEGTRVYILDVLFNGEATNMVKVGMAHNPKKRIVDLNSSFSTVGISFVFRNSSKELTGREARIVENSVHNILEIHGPSVTLPESIRSKPAASEIFIDNPILETILPK